MKCSKCGQEMIYVGESRLVNKDNHSKIQVIHDVYYCESCKIEAHVPTTKTK